MTVIAWRLIRAGGAARMVLMAAATATASGLLLAAVSVVRLPADWAYNRPADVNALVAEPGTRGGTAFAVAMVALAPLLLLDQVVRLGAAYRERRLASLRLAGATPREVRLLAVIEVGVPTLSGSLAGVVVYLVLKLLLGTRTVGLLPGSGPGVWAVPVVAGVALIGVLVGLWVGRRLIATPLAVTRRVPARRPRPWGALPLTVGIAYGYVALSSSVANSTLVGVVVVLLVVVGIVGLAPSSAAAIGWAVSRRASSVPTLLAARRLQADAGAAGRAAAAIGGIGLVAGGVGGFLADVYAHPYTAANRGYYVGGALAVVVALLVALVVATFSLAVHSVETLLDRRRPMATLAALGLDERVMTRSQRREIAMVATPVGVLAALFGGALIGLEAGDINVGGRGTPLWWGFELGAAATTGVLVLAAAWIAVRLVRSWTRRILDPAALRTE